MLGAELLVFDALGAVPLVEVPVDAVLVAGDVDESDRVARDCVDDAVDDSLPITRDRKKLARLGRDVFLAPSSVYGRPNQTRTTQLRRPRTTSEAERPRGYQERGSLDRNLSSLGARCGERETTRGV